MFFSIAMIFVFVAVIVSIGYGAYLLSL